MHYDEKTIVEFGFVAKNYYRDNLNVIGTNFAQKDYPSPVGLGEHEIKGRKTLKLFKSWFRLMLRTGRLLYGCVKFVDSGESWLWQNPNRVYRGGWKLTVKSKYDPPTPIQLSLNFEA